MRQVALFVFVFVMWLLLAWQPGDTPLPAQSVVAGVLVALVVLVAARAVTPEEFRLWMNPARYLWFVVYLLVLAWYVIKANFDVAYRVLHPAMPIRPGIIRVKTSLRSTAAITALSNSITLTPGTLTVNADAQGNLYVHCINIRTQEPEKMTEQVIGRFEWLLKRIFE
ncbi:Na+/H+ antiporter subunit E [Verrucomicrobiota bacterium]